VTNALRIARSIHTKLASAGSYVRLVRITRNPDQSDTVVCTLRTSGGSRVDTVALPVSTVGPSAMQRVRDRRREPLLLLAEFLSKTNREELVAAGINYLEATGNCYLHFPTAGIEAHVDGRRSTRRQAAVQPPRDAGHRVLFCLLAEPERLRQPVRSIAAVARTSRHPVASLIANLRDQGLLLRKGRSEHVLAPGARATLLDRWAAAWAESLRRRAQIGRFRTITTEPLTREQRLVTALTAQGVRCGAGGEGGAFRLHPHVPPLTTTIHVESWPPKHLRELGLAPDREGPVVLLRTLTNLDLHTEIDGSIHAHPLLLYAELNASRDPRTREAGRWVLENFLTAYPDA
jgi:hypothetical protein